MDKTQVQKDKKPFKYYSKKLGRIVSVRKHKQHYWIKENDRWSRIDPVKYHLVDLKEARKLNWLSEGDIRLSKYDIPEDLNEEEWKEVMQNKLNKIIEKYEDADRDDMENKFYELCELGKAGNNVAPQFKTGSRVTFTLKSIALANEAEQTMKEIPPHPKWGIMAKMYFPLAETVEYCGDIPYEEWLKLNQKTVDDIELEYKDSPFKKTRGYHGCYLSKFLEEIKLPNATIKTKKFWLYTKVQLLSPKEKAEYDKTDIKRNDLSRETKKALRAIGFKNISIRRPDFKYLVRPDTGKFTREEKERLRKLAPISTDEYKGNEKLLMRYLLYRARKEGRRKKIIRKKRLTKKEKAKAILKDDKTFKSMSRTEKSRHLQKFIGNYVKGISVSTDYVILTDPGTYSMSRSQYHVLNIKPRGAKEFTYKQKERLNELGIDYPDLIKIHGDTWRNAKKKLIKHLESQI